MRLLNTKTKQLRDFSGQPPVYAILSHTWEEEEVLYHDIVNGTGNTKLGWAKIVKCCEIALHDQYHWARVDTCCIDKSSSAELSEAINSMFRWYQESAICYAFLCDVSHEGLFKHSRWFQRGWTLQELIAPSFVYFFDDTWRMIGTKLSRAHEIQKITGIPNAPLDELMECSVAAKTSWASPRETTRIEDKAYSLLGLFGINMPLLYGEGGKAFLRLQQEIIKLSDDESLLAWVAPDITQSFNFLASSPSCFAKSGDVVRTSFGDRPEIRITPKGFSITLALHKLDTLPAAFAKQVEFFEIRAADLEMHSLYATVLNCSVRSGEKPIALLLAKTGEGIYDCFRAPRSPLLVLGFEEGSKMSQKPTEEVLIQKEHNKKGFSRRSLDPDVDLVFEVAPDVNFYSFERFWLASASTDETDRGLHEYLSTGRGLFFSHGAMLEARSTRNSFYMTSILSDAEFAPTSRVLINMTAESEHAHLALAETSFLLVITASRHPETLGQYLSLRLRPRKGILSEEMAAYRQQRSWSGWDSRDAADYTEAYSSHGSEQTKVTARWTPVPAISLKPGKSRFRIQIQTEVIAEM